MLRWKQVLAETAARTVQALDPAVRSRLGYRLLAAGALAGLCLFFLPTAFFVPPGFGLEPSWRLLLNKAVSDAWVFGDRLIWTYGPFGIFESRFPQGVSLYYYAAFDALLVLLFLRVALDAVQLKPDRPLLLACLVMLFIAKKLVSEMPSTALYVLLFYLVVRNASRPGMMTSALLVLVSVVLFFFKLNFGFVSIFLCGLVFLARLGAREKSAGLWFGIILLQALLVWLLAGPLHVDLAAYVKNGLAFISQYSDGMAVGPGRGGVGHFVVCLFFAGSLGLFARAVLRERPARETWLCAGLGAAALFVLYKSAIVRSDYLIHQRTFLFGFPLITLALLRHGPDSLRRASRLLFLSSAGYAALLLLAEHGDCLIYMKKEYVKKFLPINYCRSLRDYRSHTNWKAYVEATQKDCPERLVPGPIRESLGNEPADVFPYEATLTLASGLNCQPRPVPQSYAAMGRVLEARNLAFYQGASAPRYVFYVTGEKAVSIDDRYHLWDEPALKRLLQQNYALRSVFTNLQGALPETSPALSPILLLERKPAAIPSRPTPLGAGLQKAGRAFTWPAQEGEVYAEIKIKKTVLGRVASFLYRGAPVRARLLLEDGRERVFRAIPANLESGVLVNYFADGDKPEAMRHYLVDASRGNPRCRQITIEFDQGWQYQRDFDVAFFQVAPPAP
jgi:hypothetical protein